MSETTAPKPTRTRKPRRNHAREMERLEAYLDIVIRIKEEGLMSDAPEVISVRLQGELHAYGDVQSYLREITGKDAK